jgi:hypothetical protein
MENGKWKMENFKWNNAHILLKYTEKFSRMLKKYLNNIYSVFAP